MGGARPARQPTRDDSNIAEPAEKAFGAIESGKWAGPQSPSRGGRSDVSQSDVPRLVAFYLPQFHPIPENDRFWGEGFTEWRHVAAARPRFAGHLQPRLPGELGYYDLRSPATRQAQAELARAHGIAAFAYYHYWFHGRRLLEQPFEAVLAAGEPDLPFCLCWANEPWTRAWSEREGELLVEQSYSEADDLAHARYLAAAFADPRYLRVEGRPLLLVYRASKLASPRRFAKLLRAESRRAGAGDPLLCRVESDPWRERFAPPSALGFDAAVEFAPDWLALTDAGAEPARVPLRARTARGDRVYAYADVARAALESAPPGYPRFRCVTPGWDNSPRRARGAVILDGSTPAAFREWLGGALERTVREQAPGRRLLFVNAWNEWGEGCHLEPDARHGRAWLEAVAGALGDAGWPQPAAAARAAARPPAPEPPPAPAAGAVVATAALSEPPEESAGDAVEATSAPARERIGPRARARATALRLAVAAARLETRAALRRRLAPAVAPPRAQRPGRPAARPSGRPRVLFVAPYPVYPPRSGGSVRHWNLLRQLGGDFEIHAAVFATTRDDPRQRAALESVCATVELLEREEAGPPLATSLVPRSAEMFDFGRARRALADLARRHSVDVVQLEHTELGQFAPLFPQAGVALAELDLSFVTSTLRRQLGFERRYETDRTLWRGEIDRRRQLRYEIHWCERVDQVHVMSELDAERLALYLRDRRARIRVVPNGVDCAAFGDAAAAPGETHDFLFVGSFGHTPNRDAVEWLLDEIWPRLRAQSPEARLAVVGAHPPNDLLERHGRAGVEIVGAVDDIAAWYRRSRVLLAPVRAGSGTRLKLLEAFAAGLPVIATPLAAEGLEGTDGVHFRLADSAERFAVEAARLLGDPAERARLADAARDLAHERFDWSHSAARLAAAWEELAARPRRGRRVESVRPAVVAAAPADPVDVSVILPTRAGGELLRRTVESVLAQTTDFSFETLCVDSGSPRQDLGWLRERGVRVHEIDPAEFDHGLTRDLGARLARGRVLAFLNQDAVPANPLWLHFLAAPLLREGRYAAVQGGIRELPEPHKIFFWHSGGPRFYFTSESRDWIARHGDLGFSTVNAALRREVWERHPFGWAPILEDKKWQARAARHGLEIAREERAIVFHSHDYDLAGLWRRCRSEGYGWRLLGETYPFASARADLGDRATWRLWSQALRRAQLRRLSELLFPLVRPLALWTGNRWARSSSS